MISLLLLLQLMHSFCFAGTIVDTTGTTISVEKPVRIVTLSGNVTETVFALGMGDYVVGVDASSLHPDKVNSITKVGYYTNIYR